MAVRIPLIFVLWLLAQRFALSATEGYWDPRFVPAGSQSMNVFADDEGRLLMVANSGLPVGLDSPGVARWDGVILERLVSGVAPSVLAARGSRVFVGGSFVTFGGATATNVAVHSEGVWRPVGNGLDARVYALAFWNGDLVAGGAFGSSGETSLMRISRWDGSAWVPIGVGLPGTVVELEAGDGFLFAVWIDPESSAHVVSRWSEEGWQEIGRVPRTPTGAGIRDLLWDDGALYAVGNIQAVNDVPMTNMAVYRNGVWEGLGDGGFTGWPISIVKARGRLHVSGNFSMVTETGTQRFAIAEISGESWTPLLVGEAQQGAEMAVIDDRLFLPAVIFGGTTTGKIWMLDEGNWGFPFQPPGGLEELTRTSEGIFVTGLPPAQGPPMLWTGARFQQTIPEAGTPTLGGQLVSFRGVAYCSASGALAAYQDGRWRRAVNIAASPPFVMAADDRQIVIGGNLWAGFGALSWNGQEVRRLGGEFDGPIRGVAFFRGEIYVAGQFISAGGVGARGIARWNGERWVAVRGGLNGDATSLAATQDRLYVGGFFTAAGGVPSRFLAAWNGASWELVPGVFSGPVYSLATSSQGSLAASGAFRYVDALDVGGITVLEGGSWRALGPNSSSRSSLNRAKMLWRGNDLLVAGDFTLHSNVRAIGFAIWHNIGLRLEYETSSNGLLRIRATGAVPTRFWLESTSDFENWSSEGASDIGNIRVWEFPASEGMKAIRARN